jgi:dihydrofolate reductase
VTSQTGLGSALLADVVSESALRSQLLEQRVTLLDSPEIIEGDRVTTLSIACTGPNNLGKSGQTMRKLTLFMHMSLDGYVAAVDQSAPFGWAGDDGALETVVPQLIEESDTLLLGRVLADDLLGYWLNAETTDPELSSGGLAYARWATDARKAVLSNAEDPLLWNNSELLVVRNDHDMVEAVSAIKGQPGKNIVAHGGVRTAQNLARLNLIDEYQLVVHPVAMGVGRPLFKELSNPLELKLVEVVNLRAGAVFLRYEP